MLHQTRAWTPVFPFHSHEFVQSFMCFSVIKPSSGKCISSVLCGSRAVAIYISTVCDWHTVRTYSLPISFFLFSIAPYFFSFIYSASKRVFLWLHLIPCSPLPCCPSLSSPPLLPPPSSSPPDLDVKAFQAVWSLSAGCQGRDTAHWDPEWDKLTVTMFPLSMWSWEKEKVKTGPDDWRAGQPHKGSRSERGQDSSYMNIWNHVLY